MLATSYCAHSAYQIWLAQVLVFLVIKPIFGFSIKQFCGIEFGTNK